MVNILVVDDNGEKTQNILRVLDSVDKDKVRIDTAQDINKAKRALRNQNYDIMILDLYLPQTFGTPILKDGGIKLLREIKFSKSQMFCYPKYVIALSGYKEEVNSFSETDGIIHSSIDYDTTSDEWEQKLLDKVSIAITIASNTSERRVYDYDIAVICALKEEASAIKEWLSDVKELKVEYDNDIYHQGYFEKDGEKIRVVVSNANQMGMVAATTLASKMINHFVPKYLVMTGITGGTKKDKMNYGDIIVASSAWDYRAGKDIKKDDKSIHLNTIDQKTVDATLIGYCRRLQEDKEVLRSIEEGFTPGKKPDTRLKMLIGPVVSGASVVTNPEIVEDVLTNQNRDVLGIEMEIYGVYYAANWTLNPMPKYIALKSVSDFANPDKADDFHAYASYTSAKAFEVLAKEYFEYDN